MGVVNRIFIEVTFFPGQRILSQTASFDHLQKVTRTHDYHRFVPLHSHQVFVASDDNFRPG